MTFATITPTRGDRPELLKFCKRQLARMEVKPTASYFIDYKPKGSEIDLVPRIREGIFQSESEGIDMVFIVEDDDFIPSNYFNNIPDADFIGTPETWYHNLRNKTYQVFNHPGRSSLFTTGFRISALDKFLWPKDDERFLDIALWKYANKAKKKITWRDTSAIGIKHNIGLCGGKGHVMRLKNSDNDLSWLKEHVDSEAYEFYKTLKL